MLRSSVAPIVLVSLLALGLPAQAGPVGESLPLPSPPGTLPPLPEARASVSLCTGETCVANVSVHVSSTAVQSSATNLLRGLDVRDPLGGGGPTCEPIVWTGGDPAVATNPVLNLFYLNLEGCTPLVAGEVHPT